MKYKCRTCKEDKERKDFYWRADHAGRVTPDCKACTSIQNKKNKKDKKEDNKYFHFI